VAALFPDRNELKKGVHAALRAWHTVGGTAEDLLESLLMVQQRRITNEAGDNPALLRKATNEVLLEAIDELDQQEPEKARVLRQRFLDNQTLDEVAYAANASQHMISRVQRAAIQSVAAIIRAKESAGRQELAQAMEAHLPPPTYTALFGVDELQQELEGHLLHENSPGVLALVGIGGIGKTAVADRVTRRIISDFRFDGVIWLRHEPQTMNGRSRGPEVTAASVIDGLARRLWPEAAASFTPEQQLTRVRQALKARPHLVIIDNLEDEADTATLLARLNDLARPSKFLLTTRTRPAEQAAVLNVSLDELSFNDAAVLLRHHARETGVATVAEAGESDVRAIYDTVGGNPLALKLVVTLLDVIPLPQALADLTRSRQGRVEDMYKHIYWQTWLTLNEAARTLLQAMPLVAEAGAEPEYLQAMTGLGGAHFWPAVEELRRRSLLEVRGGIREKRYGIHRLTETFLKTEIIGWEDG